MKEKKNKRNKRTLTIDCEVWTKALAGDPTAHHKIERAIAQQTRIQLKPQKLNVMLV